MERPAKTAWKPETMKKVFFSLSFISFIARAERKHNYNERHRRTAS
jgi:hypothetical protein